MKATCEGLEGFVDWTNPGISESAEEEEAEMSGLVSSFAVMMCKRVASAQGETALGAKTSGDKRLKLTDLDEKAQKMTGLDEEAQRSPSVINVDSLDIAFDAQPDLKGAFQDALREVGASMEFGIPTGDSFDAERVMVEASLEVAASPSSLTRLMSSGLRRPRIPDRLLLSMYVPPQKWVPHSMDIVAPGPKGTQEIIDHWSPFNKRESLVAHMHDLHPTLLRVPVAARAEQYSIMFLGYMDMETF